MDLNDLRGSRRRAAFPAAALGCLTALGCLAAQATEENAPAQSGLAPLQFELTPYIGYRLGGSLQLTDSDTHVNVDKHISYALAFDVSLNPSEQYELFYSRQSTTLSGPSLAPSDMRVEYLHVGGNVLLADSKWLLPYLVGSVGATRFTPDSPLSRDSTHFSASLGAGLRIPFNHHFSVRMEARGFATVVDSGTSVFCASNQTGGICRIQARGSSFFQGDLLFGAAYTF